MYNLLPLSSLTTFDDHSFPISFLNVTLSSESPRIVRLIFPPSFLPILKTSSSVKFKSSFLPSAPKLIVFITPLTNNLKS